MFATGIRQPWQMAFAPGSETPFVSDLGQDKPASLNPPDFVLKVRQGDNYGFPQCTQLVASKCNGDTKPFQTFAPHSNIMGSRDHRQQALYDLVRRSPPDHEEPQR